MKKLKTNHYYHGHARNDRASNPGSDEAVEQGCTCPVLDNGHGNQKLGDTRGFWITEGCTLHAPHNPNHPTL